MAQILTSEYGPQRPSRLPTWLGYWPWIAAGVYLVLNGLRFMLFRDFSEWDHVFVLAAKNLQHGIDIYALDNPEAQNHIYAYPPLMAMLAIPFSFGWPVLGRFIWFLINAVCAVLVWRWSWRLSGGTSFRPAGRGAGAESLICILGLLCAMRFFQDNFEHRQADLLIAALLMGGVLAWQEQRDMTAATLFGLAAAIKGPPLLLAPYLLWRGRWVAAIWLVAVAVGVNLLPDLVHRAPHGLWLTCWYQSILKPNSQVGQWPSSPLDNQSLAGAMFRWLAGSISTAAMKYLTYGIEAALVAAAAGIMGRPGKRPATSSAAPTPAAWECSVVFVLMLLLSPMSSKPHFAVLILPAFCLARMAVLRPDRVARAALAAAIILVVLLDRQIVQRPAGNLAMFLGSVMWAAVALGIGSLAALRRVR